MIIKEISHLDQIRPKVVRVVEDAPDRYLQDERWADAPPAWKKFGLQFMEICRGQEYIVANAFFVEGIHWYELFLHPPVKLTDPLGVPTTYRYLHISADYTHVLETGFVEAK